MSKVTLISEDMVIANNRIYAICRDMAFLYVADMEEYKVIDIIPLPDEKIELKQSSRRLVLVDTKIVVIPYNAKYIHVYDIEKKDWDIKIEIPNDDKDAKYIESFLYEDKVVLVGAYSRKVVFIDTKTWDYKVLDNVYDRYSEFNEIICRNGHAVVDNNLYIPIAVTNELLKVDINSFKTEYITVGKKQKGFSGIAFDGKYFWLSPRRDGELLKIDKNYDSQVVKLPFELKENKCNFGGISYCNNMIYLQGFEGEYSAEINTETNEISYDKKLYYFLKNDNGIMIGQLLDGTIRIIELTSTKDFRIEFNMNDYSDICKGYFCSNEIYKENKYFRLEELLKSL